MLRCCSLILLHCFFMFLFSFMHFLSSYFFKDSLLLILFKVLFFFHMTKDFSHLKTKSKMMENVSLLVEHAFIMLSILSYAVFRRSLTLVWYGNAAYMVNQISCGSNESSSSLQKLSSDTVIEVLFARNAFFLL